MAQSLQTIVEYDSIGIGNGVRATLRATRD
jgi:hypothetical protein